MGTQLFALVNESRNVTAAIFSGTTGIIEIVIIVVAVGLLVAALVLNQKKKSPAKAPKAPKAPKAGKDAQADLGAPAPGQQPDTQGGALQGQGDGFTGFGESALAPGAASSSEVPGAPPAPPAASPLGALPTPPPGTPADWLPDPSGAPNALRYWDGNAWTEHVAQRS